MSDKVGFGTLEWPKRRFWPKMTPKVGQNKTCKMGPFGEIIVVEWLERPIGDRKVAGSIPGEKIFFAILVLESP